MRFRLMKGCRNGVTLIELVIVIVLTGIFAGLGSMLVRQIIASWNTVSSQTETVSQMRITLGRMSRQIRAVRDTGSVSIASENTFAFTRHDGANVTYNISGTSVLENNIVLATDVTRLQFTYYNETGAGISNPDVYPHETDICTIGILMEMKSRAQSKVMEIVVRPRNLGG